MKISTNLQVQIILILQSWPEFINSNRINRIGVDADVVNIVYEFSHKANATI